MPSIQTKDCSKKKKKMSYWADLALLLSEPVLLGHGGFGETVLENPLCLSLQLLFRSPLRQAFDGQVWSLPQFYSVDFSKSRVGVKKCVYNARTIKVDVGCC